MCRLKLNDNNNVIYGGGRGERRRKKRRHTRVEMSHCTRMWLPEPNNRKCVNIECQTMMLFLSEIRWKMRRTMGIKVEKHIRLLLLQNTTSTHHECEPFVCFSLKSCPFILLPECLTVRRPSCCLLNQNVANLGPC